jgi:hypothetical protein
MFAAVLSSMLLSKLTTGTDFLDVEIQADGLVHVPTEVERKIFGLVGLRREARVGAQAGTARVRAVR